MSDVTIEESGLIFGPFRQDDCYQVEQSDLCRALQPGVKMVEFMLVRSTKGGGRSVWCVEAKSSFAAPATQPGFSEQIRAIGEKMRNALLVLLALGVGRHAAFAAEVPPSFQALQLQSDGVRFVLVINGHDKSWLLPVQDALTQEMRGIVRAFGLPPHSVAVLNEDGAKEYHLITDGA